MLLLMMMTFRLQKTRKKTLSKDVVCTLRKSKSGKGHKGRAFALLLDVEERRHPSRNNFLAFASSCVQIVIVILFGLQIHR